MRKHGLLIAAVMVLLIGGSAFAGGAECAAKAAQAAQAAQAANGDAKGEVQHCKATAQECLNHMAADLRERGWVGIELDKNEDDMLVVVRVEPGSPAVDAGFRKGDVLVALNGVKLDAENRAKIYSAKEKMIIGKTVTYTVDRDGSKRDLPVTLGRMPEEVLAKAVGLHMLEGHATVELAQN